MKPKIDQHRMESCFKRITIIGDSSARELFTEFSTTERHSNSSFPVDGGTIDFIWDPYLNTTYLAGLKRSKVTRHAGIDQPYAPTYVVVGGGLWHARHGVDFSSTLGHLIDSRDGLRGSEVVPVFLPVPPPYFEWLNHERSLTMSPSRIQALNRQLANVTNGLDVLWATIPATRNSDVFLDDGLHHKPIVAKMQLEVLTAHLCPQAYDHSCCSRPTEAVRGQLVIITIAATGILVWLLSSLHGQLPLLQATAVLSATTLYCFAADRTTVFEKVTKLADEQVFLSFCCVALVIGLLTTKRHHSILELSWADEILPRQQTDEWKGWMQIVILLYHYFGMSQTVWVYRIVRLLVASYIFLTGYGHATYFIRTNDFSLRRVITVLLRINLVAVILSFTMNVHHQLYYFPLLASLWFMITWATVPSTVEGVNWMLSLLSIGCSMFIFGFILSRPLLDGFFALLFHLGMVAFEYKEFVFRTGLDFYAAYLGMAFATFLAVAKERSCKLQGVWLFAILLVAYFVVTYNMGKECYNSHHPLLSLLPILAFVLLRNATQSLRQHHSRFFAWFGRHSLETFVLQYHIWLAADTQGILHLGLIDYKWTEASTKGSWRFWTEVVIITAAFLWLCRAVSKATAVVVDAVVGKVAATTEKGKVGIASPDVRLRMKACGVMLGLWAVNWWWQRRG